MGQPTDSALADRKKMKKKKVVGLAFSIFWPRQVLLLPLVFS
jgi:hypothetical protein